MINLGYDKVFATAIVAVAGGLGVIIPPSIPYILFGMASGESVGAMFKAGIIPGILIALLLMGYAYYYCRRYGEDREKIEFVVGELRQKGLLHLLKDGVWALLTPVIILGCIYGPLLFILVASSAFSRVLTLMQIPQLVSGWILDSFSGKVAVLLVINVFLLIVGMIMDTSPAILIVTPIMLPIITGIGVDPIQFGIIMVINLAIGFVTPPIGVNLFVASSMTEVPVMQIAKKALPMILIFLVALLLITFIPAISLSL